MCDRVGKKVGRPSGASFAASQQRGAEPSRAGQGRAGQGGAEQGGELPCKGDDSGGFEFVLNRLNVV